jgi:ammonia channel protein AmtB
MYGVGMAHDVGSQSSATRCRALIVVLPSQSWTWLPLFGSRAPEERSVVAVPHNRGFGYYIFPMVVLVSILLVSACASYLPVPLSRGYSLVFSETGGSFWGNLKNFCFMGVLGRPIPEANNKLPEIVFATYEMMFACLVPAIVLGAAAERSRVLPAMVFIFAWTTLVYDPLAHWIWSANGWAFKWGVLDYAGGVPVEIASGIGGLAYS